MCFIQIEKRIMLEYTSDISVSENIIVIRDFGEPTSGLVNSRTTIVGNIRAAPGRSHSPRAHKVVFASFSRRTGAELRAICMIVAYQSKR